MDRYRRRVAVLVAVGWWSDDPQRRATAYQALGWFVVWPMLTMALLCLTTGLVLGLGSRWGLVRYWWVAVKLVLNLVLSTLIVIAVFKPWGRISAQRLRRQTTTD